MRNIALGLCLLALVACTENKQKLDTTMIQNDSLRAIVDARDSEINDMLGTLNAIQDGLRAINEAENRVTVAQQTEGVDKTESIKSDITATHHRQHDAPAGRKRPRAAEAQG